ALATGKIERLDLLAARQQAEDKPSAEMKTLLAAATAPPRKRAPYTVALDRLPKCRRRFRGRAAGASGGAAGSGRARGCAGQDEGGGEDGFEDAAGDVAVRFRGRGGAVEGMTVNRAGDVARFGLAGASDPVALPKAAATDASAAARTAGRNWPSFRGENAAG